MILLASYYQKGRTGLGSWAFFCPDSQGPRSVEDALRLPQPLWHGAAANPVKMSSEGFPPAPKAAVLNSRKRRQCLLASVPKGCSNLHQEPAGLLRVEDDVKLLNHPSCSPPAFSFCSGFLPQRGSCLSRTQPYF